MTTTDWSGSVTAFNFYNYASRHVEISWSHTYLGTVCTGTDCAGGGSGWFHLPLTVTKVKFRSNSCY